MEKKGKHGVFPASKRKKLNSVFRKIMQRPKKILGKYIKKEMRVLDFGAGSGFFTIAVAKLVGENGEVVAADIQSLMLDTVKKYAERAKVGNRVKYINLNEESNFGIDYDFILAFYVVHEVPSAKDFFEKAYASLKEGGKVLVAEPSKRVCLQEFDETITIAKETGFSVIDSPKVFSSRTILLKK